MKILVVEDDLMLGQSLQQVLSLEGHEVGWVEEGEAALAWTRLHRPDLLILDLNLPRKDGVEVLEGLQAERTEASVMVLTARGTVEDRVRCLNLGADDCMLKPFSFHELLARCRAILRRRDRVGAPVLRFAGLEMDRVERKVSYGGVAVELTGKEFLILEALLRRHGACCSRNQLLQEVWHDSPEVSANVVDVYITYVRRKLAAIWPPARSGASLIQTVRGLGYCLRDPAQALAGCRSTAPWPDGLLQGFTNAAV